MYLSVYQLIINMDIKNKFLSFFTKVRFFLVYPDKSDQVLFR